MRNKIKAKDLCNVGLFVAILFISAWISFKLPGGISVTLQTFSIFLACGVLGLKKGFLCVLAYLVLGLFGIPAFSDFSGGPSKFMTPSGGYLIGFLFSSLAAGGFSDASKSFPKKLRVHWLIYGYILGILICYLFGTAWFVIYYRQAHRYLTIGSALLLCVVPYILPDLVKIFFAATLTVKLERFFKL